MTYETSIWSYMYVWSWYLNIHWFVHMMFIVYRRNSRYNVCIPDLGSFEQTVEAYPDIGDWSCVDFTGYLQGNNFQKDCCLLGVAWTALNIFGVELPLAACSICSHATPFAHISCLYLWMYDVPSLFFSTRQCSWGKIQLAWVARWRQRYHSFLSWKFKLCT